MDFAFTDEQDALRAAVREQMSERYPIERVGEIADGDGFDRAEWQAMVDAGWVGISVPESLGGAGLSFLEEAIVTEELGRALYPGPWLSCVVLALPVLVAADASDLVKAVLAGARIPTVAWAGPDGRFDADPPPKAAPDQDRLTVTRLFVPDPAVSDLLVIVGSTPDGPGFWALDRSQSGVDVTVLPTVDATRGMGEVVVEGATATVLHIEDARFTISLRDRALAALAAESIGVASAGLDLAVAYARTRRQFGRPIGAFQAVSHQLAHGFTELETARSLAYWAAWAVAEGEADAGTAAAAAKARASEAAVSACERAIQAHGGVGFTWDHPLHRFYKRALGISALFGNGPELRARIASTLLD
jgi:alkylation response protein AidB-like acyl-CoA dehydrogenase